MGSDIVVNVTNVVKRYKQTEVVKPLSFSIKKGETIALCGGNGAGKSTLIKMIAGILPPTDGHIEVNGLKHRQHRYAYAASLGYMPDDYHFQAVATVNEWLLYHAKLRRLNEDHVTSALETVGLIDERKNRIGNLSKGMKQRLLLAQAIMGKPSLLLFDEPTNGLDPRWISTFVQIISKVKKSGTSVFFSTHQLDVAVETADIIFVMSNGRLMSRFETSQYHDQDLMLELFWQCRRNESLGDGDKCK